MLCDRVLLFHGKHIRNRKSCSVRQRSLFFRLRWEMHSERLRERERERERERTGWSTRSLNARITRRAKTWAYRSWKGERATENENRRDENKSGMPVMRGRNREIPAFWYKLCHVRSWYRWKSPGSLPLNRLYMAMYNIISVFFAPYAMCNLSPPISHCQSKSLIPFYTYTI